MPVYLHLPYDPASQDLRFQVFQGAIFVCPWVPPLWSDSAPLHDSQQHHPAHTLIASTSSSGRPHAFERVPVVALPVVDFADKEVPFRVGREAVDMEELPRVVPRVPANLPGYPFVRQYLRPELASHTSLLCVGACLCPEDHRTQ